MSAPPISRKEFLFALARSGPARVLAALLVFAIACLLAYVCWQARALLGFLIASAVVIAGWRMAWNLLPFSAERRTRWARQDALADRFPSYRYRNMLWFGLAAVLSQLWRDHQAQAYHSPEYLVPFIFTLLGTFSQLVWRLRHRDLSAM